MWFKGLGKIAASPSDGLVTATVARLDPPGDVAHDDLVCAPPVSPAIIQHAVWLHVRFTLSNRDVGHSRWHLDEMAVIIAGP
jgi:hypothetical protein